MAEIKKISARIWHKHDIEANWENVADFIPGDGEIIIYDPDENFNFPRIKIGDGITSIGSLGFYESFVREQIISAQIISWEESDAQGGSE